jgi:DNA-binding FadR family transcriptional regulator
MSAPSFISITDQVAGYLRSEILRGCWSGTLPGKHLLAAALGVNNKTIEAAMRQLEQSGLLLPQGAGRCRLINLPSGHRTPARTLRIALLVNDKSVDERDKFYLDYRHALEEAGHTIVSLPHSPAF